MDISGLSVAEIKKLAEGPEAADEALLLAMANDRRAGVREIYRKLKRLEAKAKAETRRLDQMFLYEDDLRTGGRHPVAGVDEAGRGPLAGPVVAAAVILPERADLSGLNDSKKLTPRKREALAAQIKEAALAWAVGLSTVEEINRDNIHQASLSAMRRAVAALQVAPVHLLVDGFRITQLTVPQTPLVGGDGLSASIAAASILAKVERDRIMDAYHEVYPAYGFHRHKGYGTQEHLNALASYGPCPIHRAGFRPVKDLISNSG